MDRPLDDRARRLTLLRRTAIPVLVLGGVVLGLSGAGALLRPSIGRDRIRTAVVDRGPLEATLSAMGTVVPEIEEVISSPIDARVLEVLLRPGAAVWKGQPIVRLEMGESELALERAERNLSLKANQEARTRLDLEATLATLAGQEEVRRLALETLLANVERNRKLFAEGLVSQELLKQSELDAAKARVELVQVQESRRVSERSTELTVKGLELERGTLEKERTEARQQLEQATAKAGRDGVLTQVVTEVGGRVRKGDVLARVADLSSFRVEATFSDVNAPRLVPGTPARVRVAAETLEGSLARVLPTVQNGAVTVVVSLEKGASPALRPNLRVDVDLVLDRRASALRLAKGSYVGGEGTVRVFVLRGDRARRTDVRLGASGVERNEVLSGLSEGDEVIVSDMSRFAHLEEVRVR